MIRNLEPVTISDWTPGRFTTDNQANVPNNALLVAKNVTIQSGALKPVPGYAKVIDTTLAFIERIFSFERQTDAKQIVLVSGGTKIAGVNADGSGAPSVLSSAQTNGDFDFLQTVYACYLNNALQALKLLNVAGVETLFPWGLLQPPAPPTITVGNGTLFLVYGTRYVFSEVHKFVDSLGTQRYHIGPPSDFSAHTGPLGNVVKDANMTAASAVLTSATAVFVAGDVGKAVIVRGAGLGGADLVTTISIFTNATTVTLALAATTTVVNVELDYRLKTASLGGMLAANPNTTHFWIFRVQDSPVDAAGDFYFVAEIPVANTTYADTVNDVDLDTTRLAPFDNIAPPLANIMLEYNSRAVLMEGDTIHFSAIDEISLGDPYSCFPARLSFTVPGGIKKLTGGVVFNNALMASTEDYWFQVTGSSIEDFNKRDRIVAPGTIGRKLVLVVNGRMMWLAIDKKLWSWTGVDGEDPVAIRSIVSSDPTQMSMADISTDFLSKCELLRYSNGTYDLMVLAAPSRLSKTGEKDWIQLWDLAPISGVKTIQGPIPQPSETDFFPNDTLSTMALVKVSGTPFIFFGDRNSGNVYRWPQDGTFNGSARPCAMGTPWIRIAQSSAKPMYVRLLTNRDQAWTLFKLQAVASRGVNSRAVPVEVDLIQDRIGSGSDATVAKGMLSKQRETAFGNWVKLYVIFPDDAQDSTLQAIEIYFQPLGE